MSKKTIFLKIHWLLLVLQGARGSVSGKPDINGHGESGHLIESGKESEMRGRQYIPVPVIRNRDSYVDAANSFGVQGGSHAQVGSSYQVPQSSYGAPMQSYGGYSGGYDDNSDSSSKGGVDVLGLVGLLGLKGLKGTIPIIKLIGLTLIALSPIIIPLAILKLIIILFKPVITIGRSLSEDQSAFDKLSWINELDRNITDNEELYKMGVQIGSQILGREFDNQCMERIACEGVLKSMPRIFLRIMGENFRYKKLRRRREAELKDDAETSERRRKDLATQALNKLKNSQFLTKKQSSTTSSENAGKACELYKCSILF